VPVNTLGQTWFPYALALLWGAAGGYEIPVLLTQGLLIVGAACVVLSGRAGMKIAVPVARDGEE